MNESNSSVLSSLTDLKRPDLQKLAKKYGIKANSRNAKLIEEISAKIRGSQNHDKASPAKVASIKKSLSPQLSNNSDTDLWLNTISPPWKDSSLKLLDDSKGSTPIHPRRSKTRSNSKVIAARSRSSSRNKSNLNTPDMSIEVKGRKLSKSNSKSTQEAEKIQTPVKTRRSKNRSNPGSKLQGSSLSEDKSSTKKAKTQSKKTPTTLPKPVNTRTFSVPKNRSQARVSANPVSIKKAQKRKSTVQDQTSSAKRERKSGAREKAILIIEEKVEHTSELNDFKKFPAFAAQGVTVPTAMVTASKRFDKSHQKLFDKMESIDDYQRRKQERAEMLLGSNKKQDRLNRLSKPKTPSIVKPVSRPKPRFPSPKTRPQSTKKPIAKAALFRPTATTVADINTNFGAKRSRLVTPKKVAVSFAKSPNKSRAHTPAQVKESSQRKSGTPFRPNMSVTNTPQATKKNTFNLQESLKKPLTWKPHKGPLKKYEDSAAKPSLKERSRAMKEVKITSRDARRARMNESRAASKADRMMKRRGIK